MRTLVAYFSRRGINFVAGKMQELKVGNSEVAAKLAAKSCGGELFEIRCAEDYTFDYRECVERSKKELTENARPELAELPGDMADFGTVVLCYPCWCGTMPMPVWTFLENCGLSGKRILPLCTNEGSGMGRSEADIKRLCPEAEVEKGLSVKGSAAAEAGPEIETWLRGFGL